MHEFEGVDRAAHDVLAPALAQLVALADEPHLTRVAARTGTSQSTLSRSVRRWERRLGITLLHPDGRGVALTGQGHAVASAAAQALWVLDDAVQRLRDTPVEVPAPPRAAMTLGFLRSLGPAVVGELVGSYLRAEPGVLVAHREGFSSELLRALDDGVVDLAVMAPRPAGTYEWLPLGQQSFALVVPAGHRLAGRGAVDLGEARDEPFLVLDRRFDARRRADALCADAGFTPRITLEADDVRTLRDYVGTGLGVAVLPADTAVSARTVEVPIQAVGSRRHFGIAWRPERLGTAGRALLEHARRLNTDYPGWADVVL